MLHSSTPSLIPRPYYIRRRGCSRQKQNRSHDWLAKAEYCERLTRFLGPHRLLLEVCPKLWHNCRSSYSYVKQGFIQMDRGCSSRIWAIKNCYAMHPYFGTTQLHHTVHFGMWCLRYKNETYFSRPLSFRYKNLLAYEKELIGLAKAVRHWQAYLWGRHFLAWTDHYNLKFLLK